MAAFIILLMQTGRHRNVRHVARPLRGVVDIALIVPLRGGGAWPQWRGPAAVPLALRAGVDLTFATHLTARARAANVKSRTPLEGYICQYPWILTYSQKCSLQWDANVRMDH